MKVFSASNKPITASLLRTVELAPNPLPRLQLPQQLLRSAPLLRQNRFPSNRSALQSAQNPTWKPPLPHASPISRPTLPSLRALLASTPYSAKPSESQWPAQMLTQHSPNKAHGALVSSIQPCA